MITIPATVIGIISSVVIELLKIIPALRKTDLRKQITAFVVTFVIVFGYTLCSEEINGTGAFLNLLALSLTVAYGVFKTVLKGIETTIAQSKRVKRAMATVFSLVRA